MTEVNQKTGKPYSQEPAAVAQRARNEARSKKWGTKDDPGIWQQAYAALRDEVLSSKTCAVVGCPCEGKGKAERFVKESDTADLASPSATHTAGEFAWVLLNAVPACHLSQKQKKSGGYVKKADRQATLVADHIAAGGATDPETLKRVMEDA